MMNYPYRVAWACPTVIVILYHRPHPEYVQSVRALGTLKPSWRVISAKNVLRPSIPITLPLKYRDPEGYGGSDVDVMGVLKR